MIAKKALFIIPVAVVLILLVTLVLVPAVNTEANGFSDTIYVNGAVGNDAWSGTHASGGAPDGPKQTIQAGIDAVNPGGGTVYVAAGIYYENLVIHNEQNLVGSGAPVTIIDGGGTGRVITIASNPTDENLISGFTIQNGDVSDDIYGDKGYYPYIGAGINIPLLQLLPSPSGGVLYSCQGGGIATYHITTINDCTIRNNQACVGGGVFSTGELYMNRCTVSGNTADTGGGGIFNGGYFGVFAPAGPETEILNTTMELTNCTISNNSLTGLQHIVNAPQINGDHIGHTFGAGILNYGTMTLLNCTVAFNNTNNDATAHGGGFANIYTVLVTHFNDNTIIANKPAGDGASNSVRPLFTACFKNPIVANNTASDGASVPVQIFSTASYFKNTIVANNTAGDGVSNNGYTGAPFTLLFQGNKKNTMVANNTAGDGLINNVHTLFTAYFKNTVVANDTAGDGASITVPTAASSTISQGNNLDSENSCGFNQPTDQTNTDPLLGPLHDNGGPTFTHAITPASPAYNKGTNTGAPPTDQRGVTRPQNGTCDIGAYESEDRQVSLPPQDLDGSTGESESTTLRSPHLKTTNLAANPSQTVANKPIIISANVVNDGGMVGSTRVALKINGKIEQTELVTVGPGGSRPVRFTVTKEEPGNYTVILGGEQTSFAVTEGANTGAPSVNGGLIAILLIGALIVISIVVAMFAFRRPAH